MRKPLFSMIFALACSATTAALADQFLCELKSQGRDFGYVAPDVFVDLAQDGSAATVDDGIIRNFTKHDKGIAAKIVENTDKRLVLRWSVDLRDSTGQGARMGYRLTIFRDKLTARINGTPMGYANNFEGRGTCKKV